MKHRINDLVVVVPGFLGSNLHRQGKPIWAASRGPVVEALLTHFRGIKELRLPSGIGDEAAEDGVTAEPGPSSRSERRTAARSRRWTDW
jgi:hypothetical protein